MFIVIIFYDLKKKIYPKINCCHVKQITFSLTQNALFFYLSKSFDLISIINMSKNLTETYVLTS